MILGVPSQCHLSFIGTLDYFLLHDEAVKLAYTMRGGGGLRTPSKLFITSLSELHNIKSAIDFIGLHQMINNINNS